LRRTEHNKQGKHYDSHENPNLEGENKSENVHVMMMMMMNMR